MLTFSMFGTNSPKVSLPDYLASTGDTVLTLRLKILKLSKSYKAEKEKKKKKLASIFVFFLGYESESNVNVLFPVYCFFNLLEFVTQQVSQSFSMSVSD